MPNKQKTSVELLAIYKKTDDWRDWSAFCRMQSAEELEKMGLERFDKLLSEAKSQVSNLEYMLECYNELKA